MKREKPTTRNKIITIIALAVIFFDILIVLITMYFIKNLLEPHIANKVLAIIALSGVFSIGLSIPFGFWLSGRIVKPILSLNDACKRIIEGDLDARVEESKNLCWEIKKCNKTECPAYGHFFERCWFITGTLCNYLCNGKPSGTYAQKIEDCRKCDVYKLYNPQDEITELSDTFNYMARSLKETIEKLNNSYREIENEVFKKTQELQIAHSELVEKHEELKRHEQELMAINKELDLFVYTVSHDLNEPLRGIETFAKFLWDDYRDKLDDVGNDYLRRIMQGANRLKLFINDLLSLSRISRMKNPYETFDPNEIIKDVLKRLDVIIKEEDVNIKIDDSLPLLYGDKVKIKEVFYNLILNGIKYNDKKPVIEVSCEDKEKEVIIYVKDNGIGIDEANFSKVFDPFKRLVKRDEYKGGTGMGLALVKRVIDEHNGKVWIESKLGIGSTFYFSLPKKHV